MRADQYVDYQALSRARSDILTVKYLKYDLGFLSENCGLALLEERAI